MDSIRTVGTREPREQGVVNWLFAMGSSRVFQRYVCEFEMLKSRTNDEMKAERSSYSTDYDWLKRAEGFQDSLIRSHQSPDTLHNGAGLVLTGNSGPCPGARRRI